jgi:hypothetical protein
MEIDLILCRAWSVSNRQRDFWYRGHTETELRTFWQRAMSAEARGRTQALPREGSLSAAVHGSVGVTAQARLRNPRP